MTTILDIFGFNDKNTRHLHVYLASHPFLHMYPHPTDPKQSINAQAYVIYALLAPHRYPKTDKWTHFRQTDEKLHTHIKKSGIRRHDPTYIVTRTTSLQLQTSPILKIRGPFWGKREKA